VLGAAATAASVLHAQPSSIMLREHWTIQSSAMVTDAGEVLSKPGYRPAGWYPATIPSTVFAALVKGHVFADPTFGMNLRSAAGTTYPIGMNFSNVPMPPESPYHVPWWFRTEFQVPAEQKGKTLWLRFDGINYRANVWLNGKRIADAADMAGAWRLFEYNVTDLIRPGAANALAVEVYAPLPDDLAITFVDWNPTPPDKNMGLWRAVHLDATGPVAIRFPNVMTHLNLPAADQAELTVSAELVNGAKRPLSGTLTGAIEGIRFAQDVRLAANERKVVKLTPDQQAQLKIANPRLWWPAQVGTPNLYTLKLKFATGGTVSDESVTRFGIREVTSILNEQEHRLFRINGRNILIRGAGYTFDMLLRSSPERQEAELNYVRDMNLNAVRLEGKLEDDHFFDLTDQMGILVMAGWCCCDHWEKWNEWKDEDHSIAAASLRDQMRRLRSHPSVFNWMNGSDNPPAAEVEQKYIEILKELDWPNPFVSSATQRPTEVSGKTGVKMTGPYDYVPPNYWELDKTRGGAHGFNTETGPGPAIPPIESLRQMLPEDHLWPVNSWWDYHAGGGAFKDLKVFTAALDARYGPSATVEEFARKAQVMAYEGHRAMFEAFGRNKYTSTGVIQWMLNNAWPSMIWHLYDWYLRPGGSYFGAKKANEPLHIQYSYGDASVVVVNSFYQAFPGTKVRAWVYDLDMSQKFSKDAELDVAPDSSTKVLTIPTLDDISSTYFVKLSLEDASGKALSSNFYWLSTKPDELDWDRSTWFYTPSKSYGDYRALNGLPAVELKYSSESEVRGSDGITRVTVENPSRTLAFAVHLNLKNVRMDEEGVSQEKDVLPILWEDNYFPLMPGERRTVVAVYRAAALRNKRPAVQVDGWNVK
jgi:exo-1,4-beta-D-glucosaminidase